MRAREVQGACPVCKGIKRVAVEVPEGLLITVEGCSCHVLSYGRIVLASVLLPIFSVNTNTSSVRPLRHALIFAGVVPPTCYEMRHVLAHHNRTAAVWLNNQAFQVYSSKGTRACILKIYGVAALQKIVVPEKVGSASIVLYVAQGWGRYRHKRGDIDAYLLCGRY